MLGALFAVLTSATSLQAQETPSTPPGYLVISLGPFLEGYPASLFLEYSSDDKKVENEVEWMSLSPIPNDYQLKSGDRGVVYVRALPPGKYYFYRIAENDGNFVFWWRLGIPFAISSGRVTYAGDFKFVAQQGKGLFGLPISKSGYLTVTDESSRDIAVASRKLKSLDLTVLPVDTIAIEPDMLKHPPFCMSEKPEVATPGTDPPICPADGAKQ
ncbi:MAG: hypothetical protein ACTHLR_10580 [Rhizomicrobium sp.]